MRRFLFRLAGHLGMTVHDMLCRMPSSELTEWLAFYHLEPFGEDRADLRAGIIASTVANSTRSSSTPPYHPQDFMPFQPPREAEKPRKAAPKSVMTAWFAPRIRKGDHVE